MKIWIICTGEAEGLWQGRCTAAAFEEASRRASELPPASREEKKLDWEGRPVYVPPTEAARRTAALCVQGGELQEEDLLAPVRERAWRDGGTASPGHWKGMARLQRALGSARQPETRREIAARAEKLMARLSEEEKDCVLIADCLLTEELLDRARVRGFTYARTGIFRFRPWERVLITHRDEHCGGCRHNCLLNNPGCDVGREKAARSGR